MGMQFDYTDWAEFKTVCITNKNLNLQSKDLGDRVVVVGPDANDINVVIYLNKKLDDGSDNPDYTDYVNTVMPVCNWAVGNRAYSFSTPDFDYRGDAAYAVCTAGEEVNVDYAFAEELYINGGNIILSGSVAGDWISVNVQHPVYGNIKTYITKRYVPASPSGASSPMMDVRTPYAGKIPAGLSLRLTYHSTGTEDVKIAINYELHKPI